MKMGVARRMEVTPKGFQKAALSGRKETHMPIDKLTLTEKIPPTLEPFIPGHVVEKRVPGGGLNALTRPFQSNDETDKPARSFP